MFSTWLGQANARRLGGKNQHGTVFEHARIGGKLAVSINHDLQRLPRRLDRAHGQSRIVLQHGADPGEDRAGPRTPAMPVGARCLAGDPLALAVRERGPPVEARRDLHAHPRSAFGEPFDPADVQLTRFVLEQSCSHGDARRLELRGTAAGESVRIAHRGHDARHARGEQRVGTRRRAPMMIARLERHVDSCAACRLATRRRVGERAHFRVRLSGALVPALADHSAVARDDAADARIGRGREKAALGERERPLHQLAVVERAHPKDEETPAYVRAFRRGGDGSTSFSASLKSAAS